MKTKFNFYNKYQTPIQIALVFEKLNIISWTSSKLTPNHYVYYIPNSWFYAINCFLKNETFFSLSNLTEGSSVDTLNYLNLLENVDFFFKKNRLITFYSYYFYNLKLKLTFFFSNSNNLSIDNLYLNANWIERELGEMYGVYFFKKNDTRKLLLDYTKTEAPLLKDFPVEGYTDAFFNILSEQVVFLQNETVEL